MGEMNIKPKQSSPRHEWSEEEIRQIAQFYDSLTAAEWIAHCEAASAPEGYTQLIVPSELMPPIGRLIARAEHNRRVNCINAPPPTPAKQPAPPENNFPPGWNSERVQRLIARLDAEEAKWTEPDEAELRMQMKGKTSVQVPDEIIPAVHALLAEHAARRGWQQASAPP